MEWDRDWIDLFMDFTDGITSPNIFRLWSAISAVAGALERRIWVETARSLLFPNMFVLLVAPPGVGKSQAISHVGELWYGARGAKLNVSPDNVTKAALVDALSTADRKLLTPSGLVEYHSLLVPSSEFGVLVPAHDLEFLSVLNHIYDNPRVYRENRRSLNKNIEIINPQLNILAGTQPGFLASLLPEEAWSMGFTSRIIMVYSQTAPIVPLFGAQENRSPLWIRLIKGIEHMSQIMGCCQWTDEAKAHLEAWSVARCPPVPDHTKLANYAPRRILHTIKLCMISAIARSAELVITLDDVNRAMNWLLEAEQLMPDIFREMVQRSDAVVIQELHFYLWRIWIKEKKPIHESRLIHFLQNRVPSEKVLRVIEVAERSNILNKVLTGGTPCYTPRPKHEHGVE